MSTELPKLNNNLISDDVIRIEVVDVNARVAEGQMAYKRDHVDHAAALAENAALDAEKAHVEAERAAEKAAAIKNAEEKVVAAQKRKDTESAMLDTWVNVKNSSSVQKFKDIQTALADSQDRDHDVLVHGANPSGELDHQKPVRKPITILNQRLKALKDGDKNVLVNTYYEEADEEGRPIIVIDAMSDSLNEHADEMTTKELQSIYNRAKRGGDVHVLRAVRPYLVKQQAADKIQAAADNVDTQMANPLFRARHMGKRSALKTSAGATVNPNAEPKSANASKATKIEPPTIPSFDELFPDVSPSQTTESPEEKQTRLDEMWNDAQVMPFVTNKLESIQPGEEIDLSSVLGAVQSVGLQYEYSDGAKLEYKLADIRDAVTTSNPILFRDGYVEKNSDYVIEKTQKLADAEADINRVIKEVDLAKTLGVFEKLINDSDPEQIFTEQEIKQLFDQSDADLTDEQLKTMLLLCEFEGYFISNNKSLEPSFTITGRKLDTSPVATPNAGNDSKADSSATDDQTGADTPAVSKSQESVLDMLDPEVYEALAGHVMKHIQSHEISGSINANRLRIEFGNTYRDMKDAVGQVEIQAVIDDLVSLDILSADTEANRTAGTANVYQIKRVPGRAQLEHETFDYLSPNNRASKILEQDLNNARSIAGDLFASTEERQQAKADMQRIRDTWNERQPKLAARFRAEADAKSAQPADPQITPRSDTQMLTPNLAPQTPNVLARAEIGKRIQDATNVINNPEATKEQKREAKRFLKEMDKPKKYAAKVKEYEEYFARQNNGGQSQDSTPAVTDKDSAKKQKPAKEAKIERLARAAGKRGYQATKGLRRSKSQENNDDTRLDRIARVSGRTIHKVGKASLNGLTVAYAPQSQVNVGEIAQAQVANQVDRPDKTRKRRTIGQAALSGLNKARNTGRKNDSNRPSADTTSALDAMMSPDQDKVLVDSHN